LFEVPATHKRSFVPLLEHCDCWHRK